MDIQTIKFVVSKVLGYGIVAGAAGVKLPQVINIAKARSIEGLSAASILMEMTATVSNLTYYLYLYQHQPEEYPFSTWGENIFLFLGQSMITLLYFHYTSGVLSSRAVGTIVPIAVLGAILYMRAVPDIILPAALCTLLGRPMNTRVTCGDLAGGLPIALMLVGRLPQIVRNQQQGHTGQLSLITYALNVLGSAARAYTVTQELDDNLALASATSGVVQNAVLVSQILALGGAPKGGTEGSAPKPKKNSSSKNKRE